ncbi:putative DUF2723 domain-containing protein [Gammaproteobacteria bacterium]
MFFHRIVNKFHIISVAIFATLFLLYAYTSPKVIALYDDGNFILSSYFLTPAYPPGYPLYILLAKLATYVPVGAVAYRVHLLSALFGALTGVALWLIVKTLTENKKVALIAALSFGVSRVFWSESIIAKCYTLNNFLFFTMLLLAIRIHRDSSGGADMGDKNRILMTIATFFFLGGLALSNHWPLTVLYGIVFPYFFWEVRFLILKNLFWLLPLLLIGLSPYLWMWWRGQQPLPINIVGLLPFESLGDLFSYIRRDIFADVDKNEAATVSDKIQFIALSVREWNSQYSWLGVPLILLGLDYAWKNYDRRIVANLLVGCLVPPIIMLWRINFTYDYSEVNFFKFYFVISYGLASWWFATGTIVAVEFLASKKHCQRSGAQRGWGMIGVGIVLGVVWLSNFTINDRSHYNWTEKYTQILLELIPAHARVFISGQETPLLGYYHFIEQLRPDLTLYDDTNFFNNLPFGREIKKEISRGGGISGDKIAKNQTAIRERLASFIDSSGGAPVIMVTSSEMNDLLDQVNPTFGLLSQLVTDPNHKHFAATIFDERHLMAIEDLINYPQAITDPWTIIERSRMIRIYNYLAVCLNLQEKHQIAMPAEDRIAPLFAKLGSVEGYVMCHNDLNAAAKILESAQPFLTSDIDKFTLAEYYKYRGEIQSIRFGINPQAIQDLSNAVAIYPFPKNLALQQLLKIYASSGDAIKFHKTADRYLKGNHPAWYADLEVLLYQNQRVPDTKDIAKHPH